ncbi:MAG: hypothetical protein EA401_11410 [Planctomycetota bacterium]|nr:MAG: hypothetical protein EA401_11410 [Planctomycetota bacterium]
MLLIASGCAMAGRGEADDQIRNLRTTYGVATAVTADLRIIARPADGEMLAFNITLWAQHDGSLRMSCTKYNVPFLECIIAPDGSFEGALVRDKQRVSGTLQEIAAAVAAGDAAGGAAFSELLTMATILRLGPMVDADNWRWHDEKEHVLLGDLDGDKLEWHLHLNGMNVSSASLVADGIPQFTMTFSHEREFERLKRPQGSRLSVRGDNTAYVFRLRNFAAVPGISATNMAFNAPEDWPHTTIEAFLEALVAPDGDASSPEP